MTDQYADAPVDTRRLCQIAYAHLQLAYPSLLLTRDQHLVAEALEDLRLVLGPNCPTRTPLAS